jgi:hypothetical protein
MLKPLRMFFAMMMLLLFVVSAGEMLNSALAFAQTVDTAWVRRYNGSGSGDDEAHAIAIDHHAAIYVIGSSYGSGTYGDYAIIKYYPNGDTAWVRTYNGPGNGPDFAASVTVDASGNAYVTGWSYGSGTNFDYATIKFAPNGNVAWVSRYNSSGTSDDAAYALAVDDSGSVYVTGASDGDYVTIKYDPNGDTTWVRRYNGPGFPSDDYPHDIAVDGSGNVYVTGESWGMGTWTDYATIKYYHTGDTAWVRRYNGPQNFYDCAYAIAVDDSGNVYVTGGSYGAWDDLDFATIKYGATGNELWIKRYDGPGNWYDWAKDMTVDGSNNICVTGISCGNGTFYDYATIKYYPNGDTAWVRRYNGQRGGRDEPSAIAVDGYNNVYVTGFTFDTVTHNDYATIKYYPNGDSAWVRKYNGPGDSTDEGSAIAVDDSGNVYVTGYSYTQATNLDFTTIKYIKASTGVDDENHGEEKLIEFALSQNYPNPFNPKTTIRFKVEGQRLKVPIPTTLKIYNVLGEVVRTLVNEPKWAGNYTVQWDGKNDKGEQLASGVYFYELRAGDHTSAKKMVLLK